MDNLPARNEPVIVANSRDVEEDVAERTEEFELKYGTKHVIMLFVPVSLCMLVVVATMNTVGFYKTKDVYLVYTPFHSGQTDVGTLAWESFANAFILLGVVVVMTIVLILFYKFRCYKVIHGWLILSSLLLLFFFSFLYLQQVFTTYNMPVDCITVALIMWNFGVVGMISIHWKGPLLLQQAYLIVISALMALVFIKYLPDWTTWVVLGVISLWAAAMWYVSMADTEDLHRTESSTSNNSKPAKLKQKQKKRIRQAENNNSEGAAVDVIDDSLNLSLADATLSFPNEQDEVLREPAGARATNPVPPARVDGQREHREAARDLNGHGQRQYGNIVQHCFVTQTSSETVFGCGSFDTAMIDGFPFALCRRIDSANQSAEPTDEERGVKLGLGDFIFYSVLVGKASSYGDWNTTIACFIAILIGLCLTLLLLAIFKKALPALPISITFGLVFYFCTSLIIAPFTNTLATEQLFI